MKLLSSPIFYLSISLTFLFTGCRPNDPEQISSDLVSNPMSASGTDKSKLPIVSFKETTFNFGTIKQGEKVTHVYHFVNSGKSDLIISNASASCGCTIPDYPKSPIEPGKEGVINVVFNSEHKSGPQHKTITIVANTLPNTTDITLTGIVEVPGEIKK